VIELNTPVLAFTIILSIVTALILGLAPCLHVCRVPFLKALRPRHGVRSGFRGGRLRNALVVSQVAISVVLSISAGLLMRSFVALSKINLGFDPDRTVVTVIALPETRYHTANQLSIFFRPLLECIRNLPGVITAAPVSVFAPFGGNQGFVDIPGKAHREKWEALVNLTTADYLPAVNLRLIHGRPFNDREVAAAHHVAIINNMFSRKYFGAEDPVGRNVRVIALETAPDPVKNSSFEVLGVFTGHNEQGHPRRTITGDHNTLYRDWLIYARTRHPLCQ